MKQRLARGFTLVELLIVIALLGVIATIVIAAINPIEQANRASDAGMKADASQIVSAVQRYYASHSQFPWQATACTGANCTTSSDDVFGFASADDVAVGICGETGIGCKTTATQGELVAAQELQTAFISKSWVGATTVSRLMVGKAAGASSSVYVCWVPKANSNRQNLINSAGVSNKMIDISGFSAAGVPNTTEACTTVSDADWAAGNCYECVPE